MGVMEIESRLAAHLAEYGDMRLSLRETDRLAYGLYILALVGVSCR